MLRNADDTFATLRRLLSDDLLLTFIERRGGTRVSREAPYAP
mgnify:CR=1 FL=1